jgi:hypothetical protein
MKRKLLLAALCVVGAVGMRAADLPTSGSGEFFLKNVGTGTYLKGDAYYGTKAVVWNDPYAVTLTYVSEGVYTIKSQQNNSGNNQFFSSAEDLYVDQGASNMTFTEVDAVNHYYTIANATGNLYATQVTEDGAPLYKVMAGDVTTDYAKWRIVSREELVAALDDASDSNPVDATFFIKDAGIDIKSVNAGSWSLTNVALGGGGNAGHNAESWNSASFNMSQTVSGLPNGKYKATCYGYYRWNNGGDNNNAAAVEGHTNGSEVLNAVFFAGTKETPLMSVAGDAKATTFCQTMTWANNTPNNQWQAAACFTQGFYLNTIEDIVVTDGSLTIGVKKTTQAGTDWAVFDEFKLYYLGEDLSIYVTAYNEALTAAKAVDQNAPMLGTALSALQSAISTYGSVDTSDKDALLTATSALNTAITNANTSIAAYAKTTSAIADAEALQTNHNFVTAAAATTFAEAIAAIKTLYDAGTLSNKDASAAGTTLGVAQVGWHAATNTPASNYMISVWPNTLTVNDWSVEGVTDGSDFLVPFFQDWIKDGESLATKTWTGTLSGLDNGLYSVSAWVRVRAKNGTAATDATGITMDVNGGGEGDYAAVDVTEGTQIGTSQFQLATYTAQGLVKDGNLTLNFNIADDNNISWLSFKNVKYSKVRDLTDDEAAVAPTAIDLKNGEDVVTEIALDATTNTVTLTPSYTPDNATEGYLTWTSSDESVATVADGVVTGVAPGTATITATSTLDATVSASATVTVTYPESKVITFVNNNATRTVYNLGENLIKNGSFEYPDAYYGWTVGTGAKMTSTQFSIEEEDGDHYIQAKIHAGSNAAGSLRQAWPIEPGKKYLFGYKVKNASNRQVDNDEWFRVSFCNTNPTSGDGTIITTYPSYNGTWTEYTVVVDNTSTEYTYVQAHFRWLNENNTDKTAFNDFFLCEILSDPTTVGNVEYATAAIPTANIGTGAFQYSQDAIDAAKALVQGTATVEDVENAYNAITTLNVPEPTQAYNLVFNCDGHSATGNALTLIPNPSQRQGLYGLKYLAPANVNLAQAFYFVHTTGNKYKVYAVDTDGNDRYITTQAEGYGTTWYEGIRTITDASKAMEIEIRPNGEGLYLLWNTGANKALAHNGNNNNDLFTNNTANFQFVETSKPSIAINTTAAGWGTTILPFRVAELPEGVKAYTCAAVEGTTLTLEEVNTLEANKPYIIEGDWNETLTGDAQGIALTYTEGLLTGVYTSTTATAGTYVLQNLDDKVAFYLVAEGEEPTVGANHAYFTAPTSGEAKAFFFTADDANGIEAISALTSGEYEGIYTIGGAKVNSLQKGINIVKMQNGEIRKVLVK